jgi:hypothetical protein
LIQKCECAELDAMRPPFTIFKLKVARLANLDNTRMQLMTRVGPAREIVYLVSYLRILPRLYASLVRTVSKSTKWKMEFAAKIAVQINT